MRKVAGLLVPLVVALGCAASVETPEARYAATVRARAWFENGNPKRAAALLGDLARASSDPVAWANLGIARHGAGDGRAAERAWKKSVEIDRGCARAQFWLGVLARERADADLRDAETHARHPDERRAHAKTLLEEAARSFEAAAGADPAEPIIQQFLALVRDALGDAPGAARARAEAARLDPAGLATLEGSGLAGIQLPPRPRPTATGRIPMHFVSQVLGYRAGGLAVADADGDGRPDLLLTGSGTVLRADSAAGGLQWSGHPIVPGQRMTAAVRIDVDADGRPDVVLLTAPESPRDAADVAADGADTPGTRASDPAAKGTTGARRPGRSVWLLRSGSPELVHLGDVPDPVETPHAVDLDGDGDLDLVVTAAVTPGLRVWRNSGGRFDLGTQTAGLEALPPLQDVACADFTGDRRPDIVCVDRAGHLRVLAQRPDGGFTDVSRTAGLERARAIATADMGADGWTDLLVGNDQGLWVYANLGTARFVRQAAYRAPQTEYLHDRATRVPVLGLRVVDVDNDGLPDVLTVHPREVAAPAPVVAAKPESAPPATRPGIEDTAPEPLLPGLGGSASLCVWRNDGRGVLLESGQKLDVVGDTLLAIPPVVADFDQDGDQDLAGVRADSLVVVMWNEGGEANSRVLVELAGPNGARDGIGARLELHVGSLVQNLEIEEQPSWLGIQRASKLGMVRIVWPDGTVENHMDVPVPADGALHLVRGARASGARVPGFLRMP